ncbi:MAG: septal ring lytic transglycosylase RlpA family protein [Candidatus Aminicenantes bacterium]|nr:septal ring lytic transglycosylase RlpA family protein [Candidatus Aminicenantes bacterium]
MYSCSSLPKKEPSLIQTGLASWYGPNFHGKTTSSREVYNMYDMTAAHRTLPFGTYVMVTNMDNGKSVKVKINDRGPFVEGRIIDLSYAAAQVLDAVGPGVIPVKIEILADESPPKSSQQYAVQVGSFTNKENARSLQKNLKKAFKEVYVSTFQTPTQTFYRVRIRATDRDDAESITRRLHKGGRVAFIVEEF